jgi:hypothetical protein
MAWLVDSRRLYAEGVGRGDVDARDEAWKAFQASFRFRGRFR